MRRERRDETAQICAGVGDAARRRSDDRLAERLDRPRSAPHRPAGRTCRPTRGSARRTGRRSRRHAPGRSATPFWPRGGGRRRAPGRAGTARPPRRRLPAPLGAARPPRRSPTIVDALRALGLFLRRRRVAAPGRDLVAAGHVAAAYERLVARWLDASRRRAAPRRATATDSRAHRAAATVRARLSSLAEADAPRSPGSSRYSTTSARCGRAASPPSSAAARARSATLFPDGSYETVDFIYGRLGGAAVLQRHRAGRRRRGAASRRGHAAPGAGDRRRHRRHHRSSPRRRCRRRHVTSYTFTDVSDFFLARAAERFAGHPFVSYATLDIERAPEPRATTPGAFDVVIAANVLHATRDLDVTLRPRPVAAGPRRRALACEGTQHPRWFDITTGLIEGWQRFDDGWRTDVPLLDPDRWRAALSTGRLRASSSRCPRDDDEATTSLLQSRSRGPRAGRGAPSPGRRRIAGTRAARRWPVVATAGRRSDHRRRGPAGRRRWPTSGTMCSSTSCARRSPGCCASPIPVGSSGTSPSSTSGFDSLMAVELRNVLRRSPGPRPQAAGHAGVRPPDDRRDRHLPRRPARCRRAR